MFDYRFFYIFAVVLTVVAAFGVAGAGMAMAGDDYVWTSSQGDPHNWKNDLNWAGPEGYWPGETSVDDTATIPWLGSGDYPDLAESVEIAKLSLLYIENSGGGKLTVDGIAAVLTINGRDGLALQQQTVLTIGDDGGRIAFKQGGDLVLDGHIRSLYTGGEEDEANIEFAGTTVTSGCGYIIGLGRVYLLRTPTDRDALLILGPDNGLYGTLDIQVALVNRGVVDATNPEDEDEPHALRLYCEPKLGPGDWRVTGGGTGTSMMIIETPVVGSGNLLVGPNSILRVFGHVSLYGTLTAGPDSHVTIGKGLMFDVDRFELSGCPD
ncbi:MAG: hypothetical protein C4547_13645 [Phycisphaerales bacterium]|nr:MAG: hypothetical protein C4547_13645 [Phycisphaerales bacterium]